MANLSATRRLCARLAVSVVCCRAASAFAEEARPLSPDVCWARAWEATSGIASAHDMGRTRAVLFARAAVANRTPLLAAWREAETAAWVRASCDIARAYAEALHGTPERHQVLLQEAVRTARTADEWDQNRLAKPMLQTFVAGLWQDGQDVAALKRWVLEDEQNRMPAAAHFFADWLALLQRRTADDITRDGAVSAVLGFLMEHNRKFAPSERVRLLAHFAPFLNAAGWRQALLDELGAADAGTADFETVLNLSRIASGLGAVDTVGGHIARTERLLRDGETGDCLAPWACLAEAKRAAGRGREEVARAFEEGIARSGDRPGYFKPVAEALTWAARAEWLND